ncbi:endoplasmic reticulum to Golgi vesicle-mediated transport protein [Malassezia pachydermatis]
MGVLAMHWRADHLMLWEANLTKENVTIALQYYASTIGIAPQRYAHRLMAIGSIQIGILLLKMFTGGANNLLFDGASLFLILASSVLFFSKIQPCIEALPPSVPPPATLTPRQLQHWVALLRELASAHILLSMALLGVILLQCGKYYSVRLQERERNEEVDVRLVRRLRQLQQEERKSGALKTSTEDLFRARGGTH